MKNFLKACVLLLTLGAAPASAQLGQLSPGQVFGNPTSNTLQPPAPTLLGPLLDKGYCSTLGNILFRGSSVWQCITPAANSVLVTDGSNNPSLATTLPSGLTIPSPTFTGTATGPLTLTTASASALVVGANGATNPVLKVDDSTATVVNGLSIKGGISGSGIALTTISSATNDGMIINGKNAGGIFIGNISTAVVDLAGGGGGVTLHAPIAESGAAAGTCTNGWAENSSHQLILVACPGAAASIQVGATTVTSGTTLNVLYNNAGTLGNATITGPLQLSAGALSINGSLTAHGLLIGQGTSALTNTGAGTVGQCAGSGGGSADPSFSSGCWKLLGTLTASNSATLNDATACGGSNCLTSTYSAYELVFENIVSATNLTTCEIQVHSSAAYQSTGYISQFWGGVGGSATPATANPSTFIPCSGTGLIGNATPGLSGRIMVTSPSASQIHMWHGSFTGFENSSTNVMSGVTGGAWNTSGVIDGFQLLMATGNITSGTVKIYGRL